jgi:hypothetical protein
MDAELGLLVARYPAREEEADHQERRRAGFLRQETDRSRWLRGSGPCVTDVILGTMLVHSPINHGGNAIDCMAFSATRAVQANELSGADRRRTIKIEECERI